MTNYVVSGGQTSTVTLSGGDFLQILSHGTAVSTTANGGVIFVSAGGLEENGALNSAAQEQVSSGGEVSGTIVSGGSPVVFGGGLAVGLTAEHGAGVGRTGNLITIAAGGTASNTTLIGNINVGGAELDVSAGTSIDTIIGDQCIESDGIGATSRPARLVSTLALAAA